VASLNVADDRLHVGKAHASQI